MNEIKSDILNNNRIRNFNPFPTPLLVVRMKYQNFHTLCWKWRPRDIDDVIFTQKHRQRNWKAGCHANFDNTNIGKHPVFRCFYIKVLLASNCSYPVLILGQNWVINGLYLFIPYFYHFWALICLKFNHFRWGLFLKIVNFWALMFL